MNPIRDHFILIRDHTHLIPDHNVLIADHTHLIQRGIVPGNSGIVSI